MWTVVYVATPIELFGWADQVRGWYVVNSRTWVRVSGPHDSHFEAVQYIETAAYRLSQGWPA